MLFEALLGYYKMTHVNTPSGVRRAVRPDASGFRW